MPRWMTPEFVTFSGEFVMHKSINVFESGVTRVGSVINWLRPYRTYSAISRAIFTQILTQLGQIWSRRRGLGL